jgi:phosphatidylserine decarboxylase
MKSPRIPIAKEGYPFIFFIGFATLICTLLDYRIAALIGLGITSFVTYFFRDPARPGIEREDGFVSPADGKIILIEEIFDDRFVHDTVNKLSIFMNIFDVHVNRIPFSGYIERISFQPGRFYSADKNKAALHNEYCAITIKTTDDMRYGLVQVAGLIARRIVCWAQKDDFVQTSQRYGLIRFGSRVDLYLPKQIRLDVAKGQKVVAGETILGFIEDTPAN